MKKAIKILSILILLIILVCISVGLYFLYYNRNSILESIDLDILPIEICPINHEEEESKYYKSIRKFSEWSGINPSYDHYSCNLCPFSLYNRE